MSIMKMVLSNTIKYGWFFLFVLAVSCSSSSDDIVPTDDNGQLVITPSNLVLSIDIIGADANFPYGDGSGVIQCTATATDAVKYGFKFT